jgi:hypothetical protein
MQEKPEPQPVLLSEKVARRTNGVTVELLEARSFIKDLIETKIGEDYVKVRINLKDPPEGIVFGGVKPE